jgi:mRNA interferase RelE/StbE
MEVIFTERAKRDWDKLDNKIKDQIRKKLDFYLRAHNPLVFAEKLKDKKLGMYRFRIGDWRIIFDYFQNKIYILRIAHRKDIYR